MIDYGTHLTKDQLRYLVEKHTDWKPFGGISKEELVNQLDLHFGVKRIR